MLVALGCWLGGCGGARGDDSPRPGPPTAIILEPPATRDALLQKLRRPDLWIWEGDGLDRWSAGAQDRARIVAEPAGVVGAVRVRAEVDAGRNRAALRIEFRVALATDDPVEVPIALDGLILGRVAEQGHDLAVVSVGERRGWAVRLAGRGDHLVVVQATAPVRSNGSGRAIDLVIPPAATTEVEIAAARPLVLARAGADDLVIGAEVSGSYSAQGHLSPRPRLDLTWQEREPAGSTLPALLAARGELAVTVAAAAIETRATWAVAAVRGTTREVVFQLDADEEIRDVELDRHPIAIQRRSGAGAPARELVVPLDPPIVAAGTGPKAATIVLVTRRPRQPDRSGDPVRLALTGQPIVGARSQTGVLGVARSDDWSITPVEGRGVRRLDPHSDLLDPLGDPPLGWLGFEFAEQPFDIGLQVEANAPRFEVAARSTLVVKPAGIEVATTLVGGVWQGRVFEVRVLVPPGLTYEPTPAAAVVPPGLTIRSERKRPRPSASDSAAPASAEILTVTLPRPLGPGEAFRIPLRGQQRGPTDGSSSVGLFQPLGGSPASTEVALVSSLDRRFELVPDGRPRFARLDLAAPPTDWSWPSGVETRPASAATWLRAEGAEAVVPVRLKDCPRTIQYRSDLSVALDRTGADVVVELAGDVANGATDALEIALPPAMSDRWVAEAGEALDREPLDPDPVTGWRRWRLKLPEAADTFQIRVRHRLEFVAAASTPESSAAPRLRVEPIRLVGAVATSQTVRLASESDVTLTAEAPGWTDRAVGPRLPADSARQVRRTLEHRGASAAAPAPIDIRVTLGTLAELPILVASRLWLRSAELPGGELATTAQFRLEAHARSVVIRLPAGSRWIRGVVGPVEVVAQDVELLGPNLYRITLPPAVGAGPVPLRIDSILDTPAADGTWPAPELVGGIVQQTAWELSLLGTRAGVGVPAGWADENTWYRAGLLWKRHPRRLEADLARWLADGGVRPVSPPALPRSAIAGDSEGGDWSGDFASGRHSYLFSRPGPPSALHFPTYARSTLLLICSGPVLLVGLLILARRPSPRWVAAGATGGAFLFVAFVEPNTGLLVAESASVGVALAAIAAAIQAVLDRRGRTGGSPGPAVALTAPAWDEASVTSAAPGPQLGESTNPTVIQAARERDGGSTGEYHSLAPPPPPDPAASDRGSS